MKVDVIQDFISSKQALGYTNRSVSSGVVDEYGCLVVFHNED